MNIGVRLQPLHCPQVHWPEADRRGLSIWLGQAHSKERIHCTHTCADAWAEVKQLHGCPIQQVTELGSVHTFRACLSHKEVSRQTEVAALVACEYTARTRWMAPKDTGSGRGSSASHDART